MLIEEKSLKHWIDNFYGYGSWKARIWFVGYEEGGGDLPEEVAEKLQYFKNRHADAETLCDIRQLYKHVTARLDGTKAGRFANLFDYRFGPDALQHTVWKNLIGFVQGYKNEIVSDLFSYQRNAFASVDGQHEALIRLYPLPSPNNHAWYYSWLDMPQLGFLRSRVAYQDHVYETRISHILRKLAAYRPDVVVMYGMTNINALKQSVQAFFPSARFALVKAIKQQVPQHHVATVDSSTLVVTTQIPALRHNRIETGFDWKEFGRRIRSLTSE